MKENQYDSSVDTLLHIKRVNELLIRFAKDLMYRAICHDNSKLREPEKAEFDRLTPLLKSLEYGTEAYKASLAELQVALKHHYQNNSHHPEHYENGVSGMDLLDVVEMFFDWKAATERTKDGSIEKSISINSHRFNLSPQVADIFNNTIRNYGWSDAQPPTTTP